MQAKRWRSHTGCGSPPKPSTIGSLPRFIRPGIGNDRKLHEQWNIHIERLRSYKKVKSGIWRDLAVRKRKTEIGHQLSPVLEQAEQFGVEMPLTRTILSMIKDIEEGTRQMSWDNIQQLKQLHESGKKASHEQPL
ncbi:ketopantoate reductase C-terminal domain-containing protein [Paenibacillus sp. TAB 01]|uniref:ketopantoate reductase C-terminal domain-containing protein n=1 Tax=Paenibacillus sp. TAB 01 TaxID=3368988 RepID=UPI00375195FE